MENITIGQLETFLLGFAAVIGACGVIYKSLMTMLNKALDTKLKDLTDKITAVDYDGCKNFLVAVISDIDDGRDISETTLERFYENYDHYVKDCAGNGYIKAKVESLEKSGKLARFL